MRDLTVLQPLLRFLRLSIGASLQVEERNAPRRPRQLETGLPEPEQELM